jgi:hypothetical protein
MEFVIEKATVRPEGGELQFYCGCGARALVATTVESTIPVFFYVCSKDGHAVTDFGSKEDLAQFQEYWRGRVKN